MRWIHVVLFVLLLAMAAPAMAQTAPAPAPAHPQGWWGEIGGGLSAIRFACQDCGEDQPVYESPAVTVAVGKSIGSRVAFGVEVSGAFPKLQTGVRSTAAAIAGTARWYPSEIPFYMKFSIGLARARVAVTSNGQTTTEIRNGTGIAFGAGYDFRLSRSVALTPFASWYMSAIGDIGDASGTQQRDVSWNTWSFGVSLTIF
jgi:hypothetical protein